MESLSDENETILQLHCFYRHLLYLAVQTLQLLFYLQLVDEGCGWLLLLLLLSINIDAYSLPLDMLDEIQVREYQLKCMLC